MKKKTTIEDIIENLREWRDDIQCDIKNNVSGEDNQWHDSLQALSLSTVIGILESLGTNPNIRYNK